MLSFLGAIVLAAPILPFGASTIADLAEAASPGVVNIDTIETRRNPLWELDPFSRGLFGSEGRNPPFFEAKGVGSGFVVDSEGLIVTNWHVVQRAQRIIVTFSDGRRLTGRVDGHDAITDIALLRVPAKNLPALKIAVQDDLRVGEWVVAIGNPLGLSTTVTAGIISALNRGLSISDRVAFIQTDAPINPGNSGGPLIDLRGRVVGMTTAMAKNTTGIGFAIPAETIRWALPQLKATGRVERVWMGVVLDTVANEGILADRIGGGIVIRQIVPGSPAEAAGLQVEDLVLAIEGNALRDPREFIFQVNRRQVGQKVQLLISRAARQQVVTVMLEAMPERALVPASENR